MNELILLKNIVKRFGDGSRQQRLVLNGLDLSISRGDMVAVTGVSGTGKTTLLRILGTLLKPDSGEYWLDGQPLEYDDEPYLQRLRNQKIGFMFQDHRLLPQLTAWQNILLPVLAARKTPTNDDIHWAEHLASMMNISEVTGQLPETLSGGEKSRVALCRALIMRPELLLADEPTGQLDSGHACEVGELLRMVNEQLNMTIVVVTHDKGLAQSAHHIYELENGLLTT